ncbi:MAG: hypothetical protein ABI693_08165 [Bryobacteraceae bacterium]
MSAFLSFAVSPMDIPGVAHDHDKGSRLRGERLALPPVFILQNGSRREDPLHLLAGERFRFGPALRDWIEPERRILYDEIRLYTEREKALQDLLITALRRRSIGPLGAELNQVRKCSFGDSKLLPGFQERLEPSEYKFGFPQNIETPSRFKRQERGDGGL